jgi:N-methylhydantoinase A/oxoprolinase/acetone carboxylase beta subunit
VHFDGHGWVSTRVVDRNALAAGDAIEGPCVVDQLDATIVLPPDTIACVDGAGNVVIAVTRRAA